MSDHSITVALVCVLAYLATTFGIQWWRTKKTLGIVVADRELTFNRVVYWREGCTKAQAIADMWRARAKAHMPRT